MDDLTGEKAPSPKKGTGATRAEACPGSAASEIETGATPSCRHAAPDEIIARNRTAPLGASTPGRASIHPRNHREQIMSDNTRSSRWAATLAGAAALAVGAWAVIEAGHLTGAQAAVPCVLGILTFVGARTVGRASRISLAMAGTIAFGLISTEAVNFILSGDRIVVESEARQSGVRAAIARHDYATKELAKASDDLKAANAASVAEAAKPGCKANCRALLEAQVTNATTALNDARKLASANPKPTASGTPLADRLGVPAWAIDLTAAALTSISLTLLAAGLIAFGAHSNRQPAATENAREHRATGGSPQPTAPKPGKRGRRGATERDPKLVSFVAKFEAKHGRKPSVAEFRGANPGIPRTTAQGYIGAERPPLCAVA